MKINSNELVSILICTYNGEKYFSETMVSVLNQDYKNIEIVVVDDGSTDSTIDIARKYQENDERIKIFSRTNFGLAASRNFGFTVSKGDWIAIIDQDDICYPSRISTQLSVAHQYPDASLIFSDTDYIDMDGNVIGSHLNKFNLPESYITKNKAANLLLMHGCYIDSESCFLKANLKDENFSLNEKLTYSCDYQYFIEVGFFKNFAYTRKKTAAWRIHPDQETRKNVKRFSEYRGVIRQYILDGRVSNITKLNIAFKLIRSYAAEIINIIKK